MSSSVAHISRAQSGRGSGSENGRGIGRALGQSVSNFGNEQSTKKLSVAFRHRENLPPAIAWQEIEGNNLEEYYNRFCWFVSETPPSPRCGYDPMTLLPTNPDNNECLQESSLLVDIDQDVQLTRRKSPDHPDYKDLKDDEFPEWWTTMRAATAAEIRRFHQSLGTDVVFGTEKVRTLYQDNGIIGGYGNSLIASTDPISAYDLKSICLNLMRKSQEGGKRLESVARELWVNQFDRRFSHYAIRTCVDRVVTYH
jgi:hypothetical protein